MFTKVTIIGDGGMGSVCAMLLCENGVQTTLWGYDAAQLARIAAAKENILFLPGCPLPDSLIYQADDALAAADAQLLVSAVPCQFTRGIWQRLKPHIRPGIPIVSVTKGVENGTLLRPTQIIAEVLGPSHPLAALSGPTIADEVARRLPATATAACSDAALAGRIQQTFSTPMFRIYTNDDLTGVELAGAMKNVIAIAAGIIDGIGAGDNAKAALITRGLAEIQRLGTALGAKAKTFAGLSGLGDLVTTCISPKGRNRSFGERIGRGLSVKEALGATHSVVEGASTCQSIVQLAAKHSIEMPITQAVHEVIQGRKTVREAIAELMTRQLKAE
ncbi:MAG TPA: NAD(P)H-dependent glycerol-3-phosphate dehydrogenase [Anaerohalosphaeraceae bacterium]|nr:NAD(P)H-dependent glycerol-3-phosphate dehydrogenase [Anaerohalosphaeraceae bacterium]HOL31646.1 NAD(P)H-dependent glycerol-3-phosphate dehydrogenase [Anaerohalosphaeraceae bacterium]HPC64985.1 NAD(P)H-dependent glycerol-3-phosphate dehydrogenase [Anaerohalosphaeraceae bacterium]HPO70324.1 NAD(P)H-dependent glycerol-3-phosphate dehydrogenase [Anaerohalosphaeraceae bacterium]HRS72444.1 NAD(P)H-dependent glycerol-3-phosphate dehydrogenase [Anaerohalosphaeraceae bacterium]